MPSLTQVPISTSSNSATVVGAATAHEALASNDGDLSYISAGDEFGRNAQCTLTQLPGTASAITSATDGAVGRYAGSPVTHIMAIFDGVNAINQNLTSTYATYTTPHDASHLTVALINSDFGSTPLYVTVGSTALCTYNYRDVVYTEGGMFFIPIWMLVPAVFGGAGLLFRELQDMVRLVARRTRIIYSPDEVAAAWREYKDGLKLPRYAI